MASVDPLIDGCIVVLSGDIAFSGKEDEYLVALEFVDDLVQGIKKIDPSISVHTVAVPGNHDCSFVGEQEIRDSLVSSLIQNLDTTEPSGRLVSEVLRVQKNFFEFRQAIADFPNCPVDQLCCTKGFSFGEHLIQIHCYNTAFLSKNPEQQGKLIFPLHAAEKNVVFQESSSLSISVLHHPANWLDANNETPVYKIFSRVLLTSFSLAISTRSKLMFGTMFSMNNGFYMSLATLCRKKTQTKAASI